MGTKLQEPLVAVIPETQVPEIPADIARRTRLLTVKICRQISEAGKDSYLPPTWATLYDRKGITSGVRHAVSTTVRSLIAGLPEHGVNPDQVRWETSLEIEREVTGNVSTIFRFGRTPTVGNRAATVPQAVFDQESFVVARCRRSRVEIKCGPKGTLIGSLSYGITRSHGFECPGSTAIYNMDTRGRTVIPAFFLLAKRDDKRHDPEMMVCRGPRKTLVVMRVDDWEDACARHGSCAKWAGRYLLGAEPKQIDPTTGRMHIPYYLRDHAELQKYTQVVVCISGHPSILVLGRLDTWRAYERERLIGPILAEIISDLAN